MTEPKSLGWVGTTTVALVASALPSFLGWLFPSWDAFFASSGRTGVAQPARSLFHALIDSQFDAVSIAKDLVASDTLPFARAP